MDFGLFPPPWIVAQHNAELRMVVSVIGIEPRSFAEKLRRARDVALLIARHGFLKIDLR